MANKFNLTAELNIRGPANIRTVVADIRRQLGTINADVNININAAASRNISTITQRLTAMNSVLISARNNTDNLNASLRNLTGSIQSVNAANTRTVATTAQTATQMASAAKSTQAATSAMQEFGKQSALAIKRFAAFSFVTTGVYALINAVNDGIKAFINYDKQLVRLQQITGQTKTQLSALDNTITQVATSFGVSSESLISVADTLTQAGLTAEETRIALTALAKTELAPSFDDISRTTEGAIAALRQFGLEASDLEAVLGSINAVAARFAVESGDIIAAIQRTGGVFASASKGVSQGTDALNEFIAVFTSVRATTRESAETIATGLRTIFTRIQRAGTIKQLREFGVELQDLEGKFVGPFEAVKRLSEALNQLDPRDIRFATIVEELGGFRQIGKVIPLIQQFATAQEALKVAQTGQASLAGAQAKSQEALQVQIAKVREEFLALVRDIGQSSSFQALAKIVLGLASTFIKLVSAFKPVLPILAVIGAIKGASAITKFAGGFFGAFKQGGGAGSAGTSIGERLTGTAERERTEVTARASELTRENTNALVSLTSAIERLESTIRSRGPTTLASGGKVLGFNKGGIVPGNGGGDRVPALLEGGEVIINRKAANKYGKNNLNKINNYELGGEVELSGKKISNTYSSLKDKVKLNNMYIAEVDPIPQSTKAIKPKMEKLKQQNPGYPNWKLFEYAVGERYGLSVAGGNKFLDFPGVLGEAKFMPPDGTYGQDKETGFIKGNNNETMLSKLVGSGKYSKNATVRTYYPAKINDFRNFALGGLVQKFPNGGKAESTGTASIIRSVEELGGPQEVRGLLGIEKINTAIQRVKSQGAAPTPKQLFSKTFLDSPRSAPYLSTISDLVTEAKLAVKQPRVFSEEDKANATKLAVVGMTPFDLNEFKFEELAGRIVSLNLATLKGDKAPVVERMRSEIDKVLGGFAKNLGGQDLADLDDPTKEAIGLGNLEGYMIEAVLAKLGANPGKLDDRSVDYASGLGRAASLFGVDPNIPTEVKRDVKGGLSKARENFANYFKKFAFGGRADGPSFDEVRQKIIDKYPEIQFRISKRKGGFGYNLMGALKSRGGLSGDSGLNFQQPSNLKKLEESSAKLADQLMNQKQLAGGGSTNSIPAMVSNGEAFVPPQMAKKIGYAKLGRMNQADRNGMGKYSGGGGISVFKGPGSGTSDSIGPIGLPQGSYVIREKATKALGLKRGGGVGIQKFAVGGGGFGTFSQPPMPQGLEDIKNIKAEILNNYKKIYAQEKKRIDELYDSLEAQAQNDFISGTLSVDELQDNLETLLKARILAKGQAKQTLTAQVQTAQTQASAQYRSDPFYMAKKSADEYAASVGNAAETSKQMAEEQKAYIEYLAREKGLSSKGLKRQLTKDVARESYQVKAKSRFGQEELKAIAAGSSKTLRGKDVTGLLQTDTQEGRQVQDIVNAFEAKIKEINPTIGGEKARQEAEKLAVALAKGNQSVQQVIASDEELNKLLTTQISDTDAYNEAIRRAAAAAGISEEALKSLAGEAEVARREFAETPEGKRYGVLSEIAPDMTKKFSQSGLGKGLGKVDDFFTGKGGILSKGAAKLGGFSGIAAGATAAIPFLADSLLTKEQKKDPNIAGGLSAATGALSMGAAAYEMTGGGIPGLIAAAGAALLGGIKGFFEGKNQAIFTNAIDNLAKTTNSLEHAFKELEKEATPKNIKAFNKAAGDAFIAQQDIGNIAFSEQRDEFGSATSGAALAGAAGGAAYGAAMGSIVPALGTAVGAAVGAGLGYLAGAVTDYYSKFDPQQIAESGAAYVNGAVSQYEMQTRGAQIKTDKLPIAEVDSMMESLNNGVRTANPIIRSYAEGLRSTGKYSEDQIATLSDEQSAIAAFLQLKKAQLGSEEAAVEELKKNKNAAIEIGREIVDAEGKRIYKEDQLKSAIKQVTVASESLLDIYRRLGANIQRFEAELGDVSNNIKGYLGDLSGNTEIQNVDRSGAERVLGNISAYSADEVRGAAGGVSAMLGNTKESKELADTASASKIITDQLPALLRSNQGDRGAAIDQLEKLLSAQGLDSGAIDAVLEEMRKTVSEGEDKDIGTLIQDIDQGIISKFSEQASEGAKKLQELAATYNNAIQEFINLQNQQNQAILKANEYYRQAAQIRLNAELDLAKALGRNLSLEELNKPFETEIGSLTQGLMDIGVLGADQAMDPAAIAAGIQEAANRNLAIEASQKELGASFGEGTDEGQRQALNQAQLDNIQALGENKRAIEEGQAALEKLANDGSKAANALAKIQEEQKRLEAYGAGLDQVLTASPEDLIKMNFNTDAINKVLAGDTRGLKTSSGRRAAYAGLEQDRGLIGEAEYNKRLAVLRRQSLMATQGKVTPEQEEAIARLEKGLPGEEDPNVKAYREAVAVQEKAAKKLGDLQMASADKIGTAMDDLRVFLQDKFPDLLAKAVTDAKTASAVGADAGKPTEAKPEAKAEQKRREEADKAAEMRQKEIEKAEKERKTKSDQAARLDREATASEAYRASPIARGLATNAAEQEAEAAAKVDRLKAEDEAAKQAEKQQRASFDTSRKQEEQKAKEAKTAEEARKASENRAKTEDAIDRATRAQQGGGTVTPPLPAPAAPGTTQATYTGTRTAAGSVVRPAQYAGVSGPIDTFAQARRKQEVAERGQALQGLGLVKTSKEEELAKKERALKAASIAAAGAGTLETSPNVLAAQQAVDMAKQDLISINEQITAEKQRLAQIAEQTKQEEANKPQTPSTSTYTGASATKPIVPGASSPTSIAPVPVTQPTRTQTDTRQQTNTPAPSGPSGGMGYALTIDDKSVQFLANLTDTFNQFGTYVDKLAGLDLSIEFAGNITVDVNITGAAGLAALDQTMRDLATSLVDAKVSELRDEISSVTRGAVRPSASRGSVSP